MKPRTRTPRNLEVCLRPLAVAAILLGPSTLGASGPSPWAFLAPIEVSEAELHELTLSTEVLGAARSDLADLRVLDAEGMELPFVVVRPVPKPAQRVRVKTFHAELSAKQTVIDIDTGTSAAVDQLRLETPEAAFIKAATIEGAEAGKALRRLAQGVPLFRQNGSENLRLELPPANWARLRITVDDERNNPIAWTGAMIDEAPGPDELTKPVAAGIISRDDDRNSTRFEIDLGAPNLTLATLSFVTSEPLFQRRVSLREVELAEDGIHEREVHDDFIYAVGPEDDGSSRRTTLTINRVFPKRELIVVVANDDSPPMKVEEIRVTRRPVQLRFSVREPGPHRLYLGNPRAAAPKYDLSEIEGSVKAASARAAPLGVLQPNPDFKAPEALPDLAELGAELDATKWRYLKPVLVEAPGVQAVELDLDVLSHAAADLSDLRLVIEGHQVPYVIEHTSIRRTTTPTLGVEKDAKRPSVTRWTFQLPKPRLPLSSLECQSPSSLFRRDLQLSERVSDGRGGKYVRTLGATTWERRSEDEDRGLSISLSDRPSTTELRLETDNGDNPPLELTQCEFSYRAQRLVFKSKRAPELRYGNPKAMRPRYDLSLVADELLAAPRVKAGLGPERDLGEKSGFDETQVMAVEGWIFWAILAAVMVGLLLVIAKLLPKSSSRD